jgi:hypothetical protein
VKSRTLVVGRAQPAHLAAACTTDYREAHVHSTTAAHGHVLRDLEIGTLMGVPMQPEQIEELMHAMNQPKVAETDPEEHDAGEPPEASASPR